MKDDLDVVALAEDVLADVPRLARLDDGGLQRIVLGQVLAADVDEGQVAADRVAGDQDPFQYLMRALLDQVPVLETAGLALIGIADEVARVHALRQEAPFVAGREAGTAAATEPALLDQLDKLVGLHLERLLEAGIAPGSLIDLELLEVLGRKVLGQQGFDRHQLSLLVRLGAAVLRLGASAAGVASGAGAAGAGTGCRGGPMVGSNRYSVRLSPKRRANCL